MAAELKNSEVEADNHGNTQICWQDFPKLQHERVWIQIGTFITGLFYVLLVICSTHS